MEQYQLASVLDPRMKLAWCEPEEEELVKNLLSGKVGDLAPQGAAPTPASPPKKKCKLFRFMAAPAQPVQATTPQQVDTYITEPLCEDNIQPLAYWQQNRQRFPQLAQLALHYLCLPASSAPVERIFSIAGKIFRPERCNLSDSRFEELMFLRVNKDYK